MADEDNGNSVSNGIRPLTLALALVIAMLIGIAVGLVIMSDRTGSTDADTVPSPEPATNEQKPGSTNDQRPALEVLQDLIDAGRFHDANNLIEASGDKLPSDIGDQLEAAMLAELEGQTVLITRFWRSGNEMAARRSALEAAARFPEGPYRDTLEKLTEEPPPEEAETPPTASATTPAANSPVDTPKPTPGSTASTQPKPNKPATTPAPGARPTPSPTTPTPTPTALSRLEILKRQLAAFLKNPSAPLARSLSAYATTAETRAELEEHRKKLEAILRESEDRGLRLAILDIFARAKMTGTIPLIEELVVSEDEVEARKAIVVARKLLGHEQHDFLLRWISSDYPPATRLAAARALAERDDDRGEKIVLAALAGPLPSTGMLEDALQAAAVLRSIDSVQHLIRLMADEDKFLREAAATTIERIIAARFAFRDMRPSDFGYDPESENADERDKAMLIFEKAWKRLLRMKGKPFKPQLKVDPSADPKRPSGRRWGPGLR